MTTTTTDSATWTRGAGPLTTVFTTPDFCSTLYWKDAITPPLSSVICMPPRFHQLYDYSWGFYSPGICPTGYTEGCSFPNSIATTYRGDVLHGGPVLESETVRLCCPTGYTCLTGTVYSYSKCVATTESSDLVYAIQVRWQESDLSILETDPTVPGSKWHSPATITATATSASGAVPSESNVSTISRATATASSSTIQAAKDSSSNQSSGLSGTTTFGLAAIAVGLAFVISAVAFYLWVYRRKKREQRNGTRLDTSPSMSGSTLSMHETLRKPELDSKTVLVPSDPCELQAERDVAEMPVPHFIAELPGSMPEDFEEERTTHPPKSAGETSQSESEATGHWRRRSTLKSTSDQSTQDD